VRPQNEVNPSFDKEKQSRMTRPIAVGVATSGSSRQQVVVTGLGVVSPVGLDVGSTWASVVAGRSGIVPISRFEVSEPDYAIAGEIRGFDPQGRLPIRMIRNADRSVHFGAVAALEALGDAGLANRKLGPRAGVVLGSSLGGQSLRETQHATLEKQGVRRMNPTTLPNILPDAASGYIAMISGAKGPNMAVTSASATGASAIGEAAEIIRRGDADIMIAGATEAPLTPVLFAGFAAMRTMALNEGDPAAACKPFDLHRTGFVLAEGAAAIVLESGAHAETRGARAYAEIAGYGTGNDAFHIVASDPTGRGAVLAMSTALRKAGLTPEQVGYINAHGTASQMNDRVETAAIKTVFGDYAYRLPISSTKSMTGHLMGAAGAIEAVITVLSLHNGILPPTINYKTPDPECDLDYVPNQAREAPGIQAALTHSVGLGGHNASLIFRRTPSD